MLEAPAALVLEIILSLDRYATASEGVYAPDSPVLEAVLAQLPHGLRAFQDHARLFLHTICVKRWLGDVDKEGWSRLNSLILRESIHERAVGPIITHFRDVGVIETSPHSKGNFPMGYRITPTFAGLPRRFELSDHRLITKRRAWRESFARETESDKPAPVESRLPALEHMARTLDMVELSEPAENIIKKVTSIGVDPCHASIVCWTSSSQTNPSPSKD